MSPPTSSSSLLQPLTHWALLLPPLTIWICVSATLRFGYYGDSQILLGPSSSRLIKTSSVFVKQIQVSKLHNHQLILHVFNQKPQLSSQTNWTASNFFLVEPYKSKGISLWLNKGSIVHVKWVAHTISHLNQLHGMVIKGEKKFEQLQPQHMSFDAISVNGKEAEYIIEEDDRYHIGVLNTNAKNIIFSMNINVSAKVYDTTKAKKICSTSNGSCRLNFILPNTKYVVLTTANNGGGEPYVEISMVARVLSYMLLLVFLVIVIYFILKWLEVSNGGDQNINTIVDTYRATNVAATTQTETVPLLRAEQSREGTNAEDEDEEGSEATSSCSEELYDEKLCVVCYDEQRNSFFVPCGHCATCYDCAKRIVDEEGKVCPICRRLVRKVRRLFHS